jgi:hypothetical protein
MTTVDFAALDLVEALPHSRFAPDGGEELLRRLRSARIVRIGGANDDANIEGGGLIIDYVTAGGRDGRVVFAFNESGMWVEYDSLAPVGTNLKNCSPQDGREVAQHESQVRRFILV